MANAMVSQDLDPQPIQIFIPSSILPFSVPLSTYFSINPMYTNLAVGGCIFSGQDPMRLLLVQRAATERGFPNCWEIPGGSVDTNDPTILHGLAREVFEETGLKLTRFVRGVGEGIKFTTGQRTLWMKSTFEIEVQGGADETTGINLDPMEHQAYKWVTEEDANGWDADTFVSLEQREMMLFAFKQRREAEAEAEAEARHL